MTTTRDLVDALIAGDSIGIEYTFNSVMNQKVSAELESAKSYVAQNMFTAPNEPMTTDIPEQEETEE